ncbi:MAG: YbaB/EbfC family nucleoid-associated protein, partial [Pirellulales bacterium]|nr:YbaB/EbfC family nucleoid-associated protein [Pirellulales bacterium]
GRDPRDPPRRRAHARRWRVSQPPDLKALLAKAQEMQGKLGQLQQDLARRSVEASAGGGMVTARVSGELRVLEIRIEPAVFEGGDQAMAQDLIAAAVNAALQKAQAMVQTEMQKASGVMGNVFGGANGT